MDKPTITFEQFIGIWQNKVLGSKWSMERTGQSLMNYLHDVWPEEYRRITATDVDCFYRNDLIPKTIEHLQQIWK